MRRPWPTRGCCAVKKMLLDMRLLLYTTWAAFVLRRRLEYLEPLSQPVTSIKQNVPWIIFFSDVTPCSLVDGYQRFGVTCRFHLRRFSTQKGGQVAAPEVVAHLPNYRPIDRWRLLPWLEPPWCHSLTKVAYVLTVFLIGYNTKFNELWLLHRWLTHIFCCRFAILKRALKSP